MSKFEVLVCESVLGTISGFSIIPNLAAEENYFSYNIT
jgi:hypothetical protein